MDSADIKSMNPEQLLELCGRLSVPAYRAGQIFKWLHVHGVESFDEMTNLPGQLIGILKEKYAVYTCEILKELESNQDETVKYLSELSDGEAVESVLMKYKYGYTLCVSTQVGCKMGCTFCASAMNGFGRDLCASEILGQIHTVQKAKNIRISHVVLMGMGEPLDNYENVMRFLELVSHEDGLHIGMRNISLSTCGVVPKIVDLMKRKLQITLSVSLHAPNDNIRDKLMPVNRKWNLDALLAACREYAKITGRRISFEYAMIRDVNDSDVCARELCKRLKGIRCHVNLIQANEVQGSPARKSTRQRLENFSNILQNNEINVTIRRTLGSDINASCGQLRRSFMGD